MKKSTFAKIFAYISMLSTLGVAAGLHVGHVGQTDFLHLVALLSAAITGHVASSTDGTN